MIRLRSGWATDPGRVRSSNQDRVLVIDGRVFAVADGMGGHRGGEVAAQIVVDQLRHLAPGADMVVSGGGVGAGTDHDDDDPDTAVLEMPLFVERSPAPEPAIDPAPLTDAGPTNPSPLTTDDTPPLTTERLVDIVQRANLVVLTRASHDRDLHGMGTTLTAIALVASPGVDGRGETLLAVVNVGDSRTYWMRQGRLEQLTEDHSIVAELIRDGRLTPDEARNHRQRSVLTRALGVEPDVDVDVIEVIPVAGQRFLACSDGLYGEVPDEIIGAILRRLADPDEAARELVRTAIERGGRDNVSVVVVDVLDDDDLAARASAAVAGDQRRGRRGERTEAAATETPTNGAAPRSTTNTAAAAPRKVRRRDRPRTPWPVNLRVLLFLALLGGLAAIVVWVWKNAPDVVSPSDTTVAETVVPTPSTSLLPTATGASAVPTLLTPPTTATVPTTRNRTPSTTRILSLPSTTALLDLQPTSAARSVASGAPTIAPAPSTTLDPFGPASVSTKAR